MSALWRRRWWILVAGLLLLYLVQPFVRFMTHRLDDRLAVHVRRVLDDGVPPAPQGTQYAFSPKTQTAAMKAVGFGQAIRGGFGGYAQRGLLQGLASYDGHWHHRLVPTVAPGDEDAFRQLCKQVCDYYVRMLTVPGADARSQIDHECRLWVGSIQYPTRARRSVRQFVTINVFGDPHDNQISVSIDLRGSAVGISPVFSSRGL